MLVIVILGKGGVFVEFVASTNPCSSSAPSTKTSAKPLYVRVESVFTNTNESWDLGNPPGDDIACGNA